MNNDLAWSAALACAALVPTTIGFAVAWFRTTKRMRQLENQLARMPEHDERAERLEQIVDSLASQIDQLANGQEFFNRVITDKLDKVGRLAIEPPKVITPH
jgi:hypothetical protein